MYGDERRSQLEQFELKLARALLAQDFVTPEGLEEALRQQVVLGGHLATNLWELGYASGSKLSLTSAKILGVPTADPRLVADTPEDLRRLLPREFVQRSRIIPVQVTGSVLQVATCEPWDLRALGEAAHLSGFPVEPYFLAEVPLMALLAKLYYISPGLRFGHGIQSKKRRAPMGVPVEPVAVAPRDDHAGGATPLQVLRSFESGEGAKLPRAHVVQPRATDPTSVAALEAIDDLRVAQGFLDQARSRDAIGQVLLRYALSRARRAALFVLRSSTWVGWTAAGEGVDPFRVKTMVIDAEARSIFGVVRDTGGHYLGPLPTLATHQVLLETLAEDRDDVGWPKSAGLFPVRLGERVVFGIYVDAGGNRFVSPRVADVMALAQRVPAALDRLMRQRARLAQPS